MFRSDLPAGSPWRSFELSEQIIRALLLGSIPVGLIVGLPIYIFIGSPKPLIALLLLWIFALVIVGVVHNNLSCPRCGKPFFHTNWSTNSTASKCVNCGFPKWGGSEVG